MLRTMPRPISYRRPPREVAGYDPTRDAGDCRWDAEAARRACEFFPTFLTHHKAHTGAFKLEPWQRAIVSTLFGWRRLDGTRRYRESLICVPRKNGKTHLGAGIALELLLIDGEPGAEVYSAAYSREQASLVFQAAAGMVHGCESLDSRCEVIDSSRRIVVPAAGARYVALPAEASSAHGYSSSGVIFDELHTQRNRDLYDVLKSGTGARRQPLFVSITTAGWDRHSICHELWQYARQVRDGGIRDPYFLPVLYETQDGDDWQDEAVWRRCNPNLGVSVSVQFLREECERARQLPSYENTFRNLYLNQWTEQATRWLSMELWNRGATPEVPELAGADCYAGLDLAAVQDTTALALVFPRSGPPASGGDGEKITPGPGVPHCSYWVKVFFWLPAEAMHQRVRRDRVPYDQWAAAGHITVQPTASIDHDLLLSDIERILSRYRCRQIAVDRWNAEHVMNRLSKAGLEVVNFGQGYRSMTGPTKLLEKLVLDGRIHHGGNPVLTWQAGNVAVERDAAENLKPSKEHSTERIDGIVATIMALGVASVAKPRVQGSLLIT
jgi:phage terminase large subunit-like protein